MDDWKEKFEEEFAGATGYINPHFSKLIKEFISSLLSSQEQKHKKEMEELIESIPDTREFTGKDEELISIKQQLKAKYLTKGKE